MFFTLLRLLNRFPELNAYTVLRISTSHPAVLAFVTVSPSAFCQTAQLEHRFPPYTTAIRWKLVLIFHREIVTTMKMSITLQVYFTTLMRCPLSICVPNLFFPWLASWFGYGGICKRQALFYTPIPLDKFIIRTIIFPTRETFLHKGRKRFAAEPAIMYLFRYHVVPLISKWCRA